MTKGIIRKVDDLGRVVIPKGTRDTLSIDLKDPLEITIEERSGKTIVILRKYYSGCILCDALDNCIIFQGKNAWTSGTFRFEFLEVINLLIILIDFRLKTNDPFDQ